MNELSQLEKISSSTLTAETEVKFRQAAVRVGCLKWTFGLHMFRRFADRAAEFFSLCKGQIRSLFPDVIL